MSVTTVSGPDEAVETEPKKKGKRKLVAIGLVFVLAAGAWWFMLRPSPSEGAPEPGAVVTLEPIQVNLASGHYLRIGIALQASAGAAEVDGSKALDATIDLFSGQPMDKLAEASQRDKFKSELGERLEKRYDGEVIDVYFTDFVTQ